MPTDAVPAAPPPDPAGAGRPRGEHGPTPNEARGPHWRRTGHGHYVPADLPYDGPHQRVLEAAHRLPAHGAVTGWAALLWLGSWWLDGSRHDGSRRPVDVATGMVRCRPARGVAFSQERLDPRDVTVVDGLRVTVPGRSVLFEMRYAASVREAVVALDMTAVADLVSLDEMDAWCERHPGWTGIPQARAALPLADENSWSPAETRTRLVWVLDAELPRPRCNTPVFGPDGRLVAVPDLLDADAGLVVEYDGAVHLESARRRRDLRREQAVRSLGLDYLTVMAGDPDDRRRLAATMAAARERARATPARERRWSIDPPRGWCPSHTVASRVRIAPGERRTVLPPRPAA